MNISTEYRIIELTINVQIIQNLNEWIVFLEMQFKYLNVLFHKLGYQIFDNNYFVAKVKQSTMLQRNNQPIQFAEDYHFLSRQLDQYKKITESLKKKIRAKDKKINYLVSYMDKIGVASPSSQELSGIRQRGNSDISHTKKQTLTESRRKQKENMTSSIDNLQQHNIFKGPSSKILVRVNKQQVKLPSLEKKGLFADEMTIQQHQLRQKVIRLPAQRLVPLRPQEIKRKFEQRFKNHSPPNSIHVN